MTYFDKNTPVAMNKQASATIDPLYSTHATLRHSSLLSYSNITASVKTAVKYKNIKVATGYTNLQQPGRWGDQNVSTKQPRVVTAACDMNQDDRMNLPVNQFVALVHLENSLREIHNNDEKL